MMRFFELNENNLTETLRLVRPSKETAHDVGNEISKIIDDVKRRGDAAVIDYTKKFDNVTLKPEEFKISREEILSAYKRVDANEIKALKTLEKNIRKIEMATLARLQYRCRQNGIIVRQETRPISSVGCYVPGGKASYPSTLMMTVVPARVAGVKRIVVVTPPKELKPMSLVAADIAGASEVYRIGGVQAISALAYGTESIVPVDKIIGPGNIYVTLAKMYVSKDVEIDMPAGPTEIVIFADTSSDAKRIAWDLISQAEHGSDSICGLVTLSRDLALQVSEYVTEISQTVGRKEVVQRALDSRGFIAVADSIQTVVAFVNRFSPEHLEVISSDYDAFVSSIDNAGIIVVNSPSVLTDYYVGVNHVLPTNGYARFRGGLTVLDYVKTIRIVVTSKSGIKKSLPTVQTLAKAEGLINHMRSIEYLVNEDDP
ncbi:MAG: histidinol dehydrogenase [Nitrososphaeria archaeon]